MRQLVYGLTTEGPTDERFFGELLPRLLSCVCLDLGYSVEVLDPILIRRPRGSLDEALLHVEAQSPGLNPVFVHFDADSRDHATTIDLKWAPWLAVAQEPARWIPMVPAKNLESWVLADQDTLADVLLADRGDIDSLMNGRTPESVVDPKGTINEIRRRGRRRNSDGYEALVGRRISIDRLMRLTSFKAFYEELVDKLQQNELLH